MSHDEAITLVKTAIPAEQPSTWADLGAGTGIFTQILQALLPEGSQIYALDKSPMMLWRLPQVEAKELHVREGDFTRKMDLPLLDGILMANALHYALDHQAALVNVLSYLRPKGRLVLVEYDLARPIPTWVPYPIRFELFQEICPKVGLSAPQEIQRILSGYGHTHIYSAWAEKL